MNFGLDRSEPNRAERESKYTPEVENLLNDGILDKVNKFEELPIIHTGCDTYASIYPEFKKFMMDKTVDEVVEHLLSLTPNGKWVQDNGQDVHLIFTGGEPLLGWQKFYIELLKHPKMADLKNVTFETNTTQKLQPAFAEYLNNQKQFEITWSCSPKLSVSGESWSTAIQPAIANSYASISNSNLYFKFVVADRQDIEEAGKANEEYRNAGLDAPVYLMPLGGRSEEYNLNVKDVADICMERGWRFTPRLHISLFGNAWGT
jgi:organic radical activating enzyme